MPRKIQKLSDVVINMIAAGEIVLSPLSVIKELVENSIDAKATSITIITEMGGLKTIEIRDNGTGIDVEDFPLLCERFATSKISVAEDLRQIGSFGFRGEALASISYTSHVTVTSKTKDCLDTYIASFNDGQLNHNSQGTLTPQKTSPIVGAHGTIIKVEDLFYNMLLRKSAINPSEEFRKISKLIGRLALHHHMISFVLKSSNTTIDLSSANISRIKVTNRLDMKKELVGKFYGSDIAANALEFELNFPEFHSEFYIILTRPNNKFKGKIGITFINDRLVECESLKKAMELAYHNCVYNINNLNNDYFYYIDMKIKKDLIDVNVHPTKKEVHFRYEREIADALRGRVEDFLKDNTNVKVFKPGVSIGSNNMGIGNNSAGIANASVKQITLSFGDMEKKGSLMDKNRLQENIAKRVSDTKIIVYDKNLVRTDPKLQTIDQYMIKNAVGVESIGTGADNQLPSANRDNNTIQQNLPQILLKKANESLRDQNVITNNNNNNTIEDNNDLESNIRLLLIEESNMANQDFISFIQKLVYVGCTSGNYCFCQYEQQLLLINVIPLLEEAFYQLCLTSIGKFNTQKISDSRHVKDYLLEALNNPENGYDEWNHPSIHDLVKKYIKILSENQKTLCKWFGISFSKEGYLETIPVLYDCAVMKQADRANLLLRLCTEVDYRDVMNTIRNICKELSYFFAWSFEEQEEDESLYDENIRNTYDDFFGNIMFPLFKSSLFFSSSSQSKITVKLLQLSDIYKIFERC